MTAKALWAWLTNRKNQKTLGWIGIAVATTVGTGIAAYTDYLSKSRPIEPPTIAPVPTKASAPPTATPPGSTQTCQIGVVGSVTNPGPGVINITNNQQGPCK